MVKIIIIYDQKGLRIAYGIGSLQKAIEYI